MGRTALPYPGAKRLPTPRDERTRFVSTHLCDSGVGKIWVCLAVGLPVCRSLEMEEDQVAGDSSLRERSRDDAEEQLVNPANRDGTQAQCGEKSSPRDHGLLPWDLEGVVKKGIVDGSDGRRELVSKALLEDALSCHRVTRPDVQIILEDGTLVAMAHYCVLSAALGSEEFSDKIEVDEGAGRGGADILRLRIPMELGLKQHAACLSCCTSVSCSLLEPRVFLSSRSLMVLK